MLTIEDRASIRTIVREEISEALAVAMNELALEMVKQRKLAVKESNELSGTVD